MSTTTSVQLVQSLFEAFGRGDIAYILERLTPDCIWSVPGSGYALAGEYKGPEGAAEFFRRLHETEEMLRFDPREYFTNGDDVVVLGYEQARVRATGKQAESKWAMVFRVKDGKVASWSTHFDTEAYAAAHRA
ncbi:nuclear transport factor 2 family protein [uncultured Paludibaculum sp.]|uniref:nuclear transport factor 2 family protein n=1 Tax=uncultured Paludibaculum sp. TaxID=1765020 RepID=UPI002AAA8F29|nr:nuclear transport factor 2 family protein [uncultured Paludibaculum sp.]